MQYKGKLELFYFKAPISAKIGEKIIDIQRMLRIDNKAELPSKTDIFIYAIEQVHKRMCTKKTAPDILNVTTDSRAARDNALKNAMLRIK